MRKLLIIALCAGLPLAGCGKKKNSSAAGAGSGSAAATTGVNEASGTGAGEKASPDQCDKVAEKMAQLAIAQADSMGEDMKPQILEMVPSIRAEVKDRCNADGWTKVAVACIMTSKDADEVEKCRDMVPGVEPESPTDDLAMPDPEIPTNPICDPVAETILKIAMEEVAQEGPTAVKESEAALGEIRKEILLRCTLEEWSEEIRTCFTSAKVSDDFIKCQAMLPPQ